MIIALVSTMALFALALKVAEMATQVEAARLLVRQAATLKSEGKRVSKEAAMAKLFASAAAMDVTSKSIQLHGGIGYQRQH